jgi:hypothetical protein
MWIYTQNSTYRSEYVLKDESIKRSRLHRTYCFVRKSHRMYSTSQYSQYVYDKTQNSESKKQQLRMKREK